MRGEGRRERIGREKRAVPSKRMDADTSKGQAEWRAGGQGTQERDGGTTRGGKGERERSAQAVCRTSRGALSTQASGREHRAPSTQKAGRKGLIHRLDTYHDGLIYMYAYIAEAAHWIRSRWKPKLE